MLQRTLILLFLLWICVPRLTAAGIQSSLAVAQRYAATKQYDKALAEYRRVADSYDIGMNSADKKRCLDAVYASCGIMLELGRYTEAMEDLLLAEQIAEHDNLSQSKLHLYYGVFYFILASQTGSDIYIHQLIDHDRTAFWSARDEGDINTLYRAFGDMLIAYSYTSHLDSLKREVTELKRLSAKNSDRLLRISLFQYSAARANNARDYRRAALVYDSILSIIPSDDQTARLRAAVHKDRGLALGNYAATLPSGAGDYNFRARKDLDSALALSYRFDLRDIRLATLNILQALPALKGDSTAAKALDNHIMALRDSLRSYSVAGDIVRLDGMKTRRALLSRIEMAEFRAKSTTWLIILLATIVVVTVVFLIVVQHKNRRLRQHSALLLERMRALYRANDALREAQTSVQQEPDNQAKYNNSRLTDSDKTEIADAIRHVMASDAIFAPDLSIVSFSQLVDRHPKAVSQVIHELFDCNFSTLINRARIVEVCRRMDLPKYADWSIEGIGESVGFKSRTALSRNFRRFTGLGIRDYRNAARQKKANPEITE